MSARQLTTTEARSLVAGRDDVTEVFINHYGFGYVRFTPEGERPYTLDVIGDMVPADEPIVV